MKTSSECRRAFGMAWATVAALTVLALTAPFVDAQTTDDLQVRLLIFSGRENPHFALTDEARIAELRALVNGLQPNPDFKKDTVLPSRLGYAGVVVINGGGVAGLPKNLAVYRENVESRVDGATFFLDPNRKLENWLVDQFVHRKLIDQRTLDQIR